MSYVLSEFPYNRQLAVNYAHQWAYRRNPEYYNFNTIGGNCTNFVSQCLFAGSGIMNYTPTFGWYYININDRSPSWTGVTYLYNFLTTNQDVGPYGREASLYEVQPGDIVQMQFDAADFQHTVIVVSALQPLSLDTILIAANSNDSDCRQLSTYPIRAIRFIHIQGVRYMREVPD